MSFHWNLSSSEDEFEEESTAIAGKKKEDKETTRSARTITHTQSGVASGLASLHPVYSDSPSSSHDEDSDEVNWEDGDYDNDEIGQTIDTAAIESTATTSTKPPTATAALLQPVTIDLDTKPKSKTGETTNTRKRKKKNMFSYRSLPNGMRKLLLNIHRTHMLTLVSRAMMQSRCCSDTELMHAAHSLIPSNQLSNDAAETCPSEDQVRSFCTWYFDFVNNLAQRRRLVLNRNLSAGAPRKRRRRTTQQDQPHQKGFDMVMDGMGRTDTEHLLRVCSYLSTTNDENPQLQELDVTIMTQCDKTQLLVAMARSLGWRARLVMTLDPIKCDLDLDHPLFMSGFNNVFQRVLQGNSSRKSLKRASVECNPGDRNESSPLQTPSSRGMLCWVEILCRPVVPESNGSKTSRFRWMHIDPGRELVDQPKMVESLLINTARNNMQTKKTRSVISYALAVEHCYINGLADSDSMRVRLTDVTPRYANAWSRTLKKRGVSASSKLHSSDGSTWWTETIRETNQAHRKLQRAVSTKQAPKRESQDNGDSIPQRTADYVSPILNRKKQGDTPDLVIIDDSPDIDTIPVPEDHDHDEAENAEQAELLESASNEAIPTSKQAFKSHPIYAISSLLNSRQVLDPGSKSRVCGVFKGELVFRRSDVSTALTAKKWLYQGREVTSTELGKPVKRVSARSSAPKRFKALSSYGVGAANDGTEKAKQRDIHVASVPLDEYNGMDELYGIWQTKPWSPPRVGPDEAIPVNEYKNVDVKLLNVGLTHLVEPKVSLVAKKLGIQYAPALLGFEGHGGNRTPTIKGIVVHDHNADLLREAYAEYQSEAIESEIDKNQQQKDLKWKKLIVGILTKDRLERQYGKNQNA